MLAPKGVIITLWVFAALWSAALAAGCILTVASTQASASTEHTSLWWDSLTCHAFMSGRFHLAVVASRHADPYLRVDVAHLAHLYKTGAPYRVITVARGWVRIDCTTDGD